MELADGVGVDEMDDGMMDSVMEDRRLHQRLSSFFPFTIFAVA